MSINLKSKEAFGLALKIYNKDLLGKLLSSDHTEFTIEALEAFIRAVPSHTFDPAKISDSWEKAQAIIKECNDNQIGILFRPDCHKITRRPDNEQLPILLFFKGNIQKSVESVLYKSIAIIGSREIRVDEGEEGLTKNLKDNLDKLRRDSKYQWSIVSGLALGCDTIAHKVALELDIRTIAVLPSGLNSRDIYPKANQGLAEKITIQDGGLLVSEYAPKTLIQSFHFPSRDKIQAALSEIVLVLDCHPKSGTLHTLSAARRLKKQILHNDQIEQATKKILEEKFGSKPIKLEDQSSLCNSINPQDSRETQNGVQQSLGF